MIGLMDHQLAEAEFARTVLGCGQHRTVVTDHTKFSRSALVKVCGFDGFDLLITDRTPPTAVSDRMRAGSSKFLVTGEPEDMVVQARSGPRDLAGLSTP